MKIEQVLSNIEIPEHLNDFVHQTIQDALICKKKKVKYRRIFISSIAVLVISFSSLLIVQPAWAKSIPFISDVFDYVNEFITVKGNFTSYVTDINETAQNNNINITLTEVYCDGENLFISYNINSPDGFPEYTDTEYMENLIELESTVTITDNNNSTYYLDELGNGQYINGKFIDDYNYAGVSSFLFEEKSFPDSFITTLQINGIKLLAEYKNEEDSMITGNWKFSIPVKVNYNDLSVVIPDAENRQHKIDKIVISPFLVTVYTSYPDIYQDRKLIDNDVVCFSDKSDQPLACNGIADRTNAFYKFNTYDMANSLRIYVVDYSLIRKKGEDINDETVIKKYAITNTTIQLKEKSQ